MQQMLKDFLLAKGCKIHNGVFINNERPLHNQRFQNAYLGVRQSEGRLYDVATIRKLPEFSGGTPLEEEWKIRKRSATKFVKYLSHHHKNANILEIGCGNGWLTHFIAERLPDARLTGMDVNLEEMEMAAESFAESADITWVYEEIMNDDVLPPRHFDVIFFAASIQYFPDLQGLLNKTALYLAQGGEIHVLDTAFYPEKQLADAKSRTHNYYSALNPEMADYYFHHGFAGLYGKGFKVHKMNRTAPFKGLSRFGFLIGCDRFGWYRLRK